MTTTCRRTDCKQYKTCDANIWTKFYKPENCEGYMSKTMAIYHNNVQKCKEKGVEPLPYNLYFEF